MTNYVQVSLFSRSVWNFDQTQRVCVGLSYIHFDFQMPVTFTIPSECAFYGLFYGVTGFVTPPLRLTTRNPFAHAHSICSFFSYSSLHLSSTFHSGEFEHFILRFFTGILWLFQCGGQWWVGMTVTLGVNILWLPQSMLK